MKSKLLKEGPERVFAVVFDKDDEVFGGLTEFAAQNGLGASSLTAIGSFRSVVLGYFDRDRMDFKRIPVSEQVEVLSFIGDIALKDGEPQPHVHVVLGRSDATTLGGHLFEGRVWPTLEVILTESPEHMTKSIDPETGLALIDLG